MIQIFCGKITAVNEVSQEMTQRSGRLKASAQELSSLSGKLRNMIGVFKVSIEEAGMDKGQDIKQKLFDTHGYPDTANHKKIHKDLVAKVLAFTKVVF